MNRSESWAARFALLVTCVLATACGDDDMLFCGEGFMTTAGECVEVVPDSGVDAAADAEIDASEDAEVDARTCAEEETLCDGIDDDCDDRIDEDLVMDCEGSSECAPVRQRCVDAEWGACVEGDPAPGCECTPGESRACGETEGACEAGVQRCDDGAWSECDGAIGPTPETCDGIDNDCNGTIDDGAASPLDVCGSATGSCTQGLLRCIDAELVCEGETVPATETCNGADDDCDGMTDETLLEAFYLDSDGDGYGTTRCDACSAEECGPGRYVPRGGDCDDTCRTCFPGASESCDGLNNDCDDDERTDEGVTTTFYLDADGDTHGNASSRTEACSAPTAQHVTLGDDCNDSCATCFPGATEVCDGENNDCDVDDSTDEGLLSTFYRDSDGDSFGQIGTEVQRCERPLGYVSNRLDCNDDCPTCFPGSREVCDGLNNDCDQDSRVDEGVDTRYFRDRDGDGWGVSTSTRRACSVPSGYADRDGDCDDVSSFTFPTQTEYSPRQNSLGTYDHNCDDIETRRWTQRSFEFDPCDCDSLDDIRWDALFVPACGVFEWATECQYRLGECVRIRRFIRQECR